MIAYQYHSNSHTTTAWNKTSSVSVQPLHVTLDLPERLSQLDHDGHCLRPLGIYAPRVSLVRCLVPSVLSHILQLDRYSTVSSKTLATARAARPYTLTLTNASINNDARYERAACGSRTSCHCHKRASQPPSRNSECTAVDNCLNRARSNLTRPGRPPRHHLPPNLYGCCYDGGLPSEERRT